MRKPHTGSGWLSDRFDNRLLLFAYYGLRGLSLLYLPDGFVSEGHGLAENTGLVFGWIMAAHQIGAALAASAGGLIRTHEGSYDQAFIIPAACAWSAQ